MLLVQHQEAGAWIDCTREDLEDDSLGDVTPCDTTPANFYTLDEAVQYIAAMRGLIHEGGHDVVFRVLDIDKQNTVVHLDT